MCVAVLERDAVFAICPSPSVEYPASVRCMCASPAVGGFAGGPISNVEADEGVAFFKDAEDGVVEVEEVGDAGAGEWITYIDCLATISESTTRYWILRCSPRVGF